MLTLVSSQQFGGSRGFLQQVVAAGSSFENPQTGNHITAKLDIRVVNKRRVVGGGYIHPFWVIEGNQIVLKMEGLGYRGRGGYDCLGGKAGDGFAPIRRGINPRLRSRKSGNPDSLGVRRPARRASMR